MERVLVSGANGYLGKSLIHQLLDRNVQVVALGRSFSDEGLRPHRLLTRVPTDYSDIETLRAQLPGGGYDAFFHFAWQGVNGTDKANPLVQSENILLALRCAQLANALGCRKLLCAGTVAERAVASLPQLKHTNGGMLYGAAKVCASIMLETYCKNIGLPFVWMQFANIFGPGNKTGNLVSYTLSQLLKGEAACFGPAEQPYDFLYIDDLLEAIIRLGESDAADGFFYIGSGQPRILKDYLQTIGHICGREELIHIGAYPDDGVRYTFEMFDTTPITACVGQFSSHSFEEGIKRTIENASP